MSAPTMSERVLYREGQRLLAADLGAEQAYHDAARRRHNLGGHTWGIVRGLAPAVDAAGRLIIQPGLAVDGYGRELLLPEPLAVAPGDLTAAFADAGVGPGAAADLWLLRVATLDDAGRRWRDEAALHLTAAGLAAPDRPFDTPPESLDWPLWRDLPDEPFPIFLGRVTNAAPPVVDLAGRVYAALVGAAVVSPAPWLPLRREGVAEDEAAPAPQARLRLADAPRGRLALDLLGAEPLWLADAGRRPAGDDGERRAVLRGDVALGVDAAQPDDVPAAVHGARGLSYPAVLSLPEAALPWSLYRTAIPILGPDGAPTDDPPLDQLRLEMFHPGDEGDPSRRRFSIGAYAPADPAAGAPPGYRPCLTVRADCQVEVAGAVYVTGELIAMPIPADPSDPRFIEALLQSFHGGMAASDESLVPTPRLEPEIVLEPNPQLSRKGVVRYRVRVTNHAAQAVTGVIVFASFVNTDGVGSGAVELFRQDRLAPRTTTTLSAPQKIDIADQAGPLVITATVAAFAADLAAVTQTARLVLTIA